MAATAVLVRELRMESRRTVTPWLRMAAGALGFLLLELSRRSVPDIYRASFALFPRLHELMLFLAWLPAVLLVADAIAVERRERTLEILLLTPLTLAEVLRAKTLVATIRSGTLLGAALPVMGFAVLFGGVGKEELAISGLLLLSVQQVALSSSLLAAALARTWAKAIAYATLIAAVLAVGISLGVYGVFQNLIGGPFASGLWPAPRSWDAWLIGTMRLWGDQDGIWGRTLAAIPGSLRPGCIWFFVSFALLSALFAMGIRMCARWTLGRSLGTPAVEKPMHARIPGRHDFQVGRVSDRKRRRWLDENPLRWLQRYPVEVRTLRWLGLAPGVLAPVLALSPRLQTAAPALHFEIGLMLMLALVLAAAGSYHRERREGSMEMLLVTPLKAGDFQRARLAGLWWQFGPAVLCWLVAGCWVGPIEQSLPMLAWIVALYGAIPAIGLEAAFLTRTYWPAVVLTGGLSIGFSGYPYAMGILEAEPGYFLLSVGLLVVPAVLCAMGFEFRLSKRRDGGNLLRPKRWRRRSHPSSSSRHRIRRRIKGHRGPPGVFIG